MRCPRSTRALLLLLLVLALGGVALVGAKGITTLGAVVLILVRSLTYGQQIQTALAKVDELLPFMNRLRDAIDLYRAHPQQDGERPLHEVRRLGMRDVRLS